LRLCATNNNIKTMAPPPSSEIMPKHDEDLGGIRKKKING
jgi:hypothetical protein